MPAPITSRRGNRSNLDLLSERYNHMVEKAPRIDANVRTPLIREPSIGTEYKSIRVLKSRPQSGAFQIHMDLAETDTSFVDVVALGARTGKTTLVQQILDNQLQEMILLGSSQYPTGNAPQRVAFDFGQSSRANLDLIRRRIAGKPSILTLDSGLLNNVGSQLIANHANDPWVFDISGRIPTDTSMVTASGGYARGELSIIGGRRTAPHYSSLRQFWRNLPPDTPIRILDEAPLWNMDIPDFWGGSTYWRSLEERVREMGTFKVHVEPQPKMIRPTISDLNVRERGTPNIINPEAIDQFLETAWDKVTRSSIYSKCAPRWPPEELTKKVALFSKVIRNWLARTGMQGTRMNPIFKARDGKFYEWQMFDSDGYRTSEKERQSVPVTEESWFEDAWKRGDNLRILRLNSTVCRGSSLSSSVDPDLQNLVKVARPEYAMDYARYAFWWLLEFGKSTNDVTRVTVEHAVAAWTKHYERDLQDRVRADANVGLEDWVTLTVGSQSMALVRLSTPRHLELEGSIMEHCVGNSSYQHRLSEDGFLYYSIRDLVDGKPALPHVTIEMQPIVSTSTGLVPVATVHWRAGSIKGRSNHNNPKYKPWVQAAERALGISLAHKY